MMRPPSSTPGLDDIEYALLSRRILADPSAVRSALARGARVDAVDTSSAGWTPLHGAVVFGHPDSLAAIVAAAPASTLNAFSADGFAPLHIACSKGYSEKARILIRAGADCDLLDKSNLLRALHYSTNLGDIRTLKSLLDAGAYVDALSGDGEAALHCLAGLGYQGHDGAWSHFHACLECLLTAGADINVTDMSGHTPLFYALSHERSEAVIKALLDAGADIEHRTTDSELTPLLNCCVYDYVQATQTLLAAGANMRARSPADEGALHLACLNGAEHALARLIDAGVDIEAPLAEPLIGACRAIHIASFFGNLACVQRLLVAGADVEAKSREGKTAQDYAKDEGYGGIVAYLQSLARRDEVAAQLGRARGGGVESPSL